MNQTQVIQSIAELGQRIQTRIYIRAGIGSHGKMSCSMKTLNVIK